jgi:co-chaperonin GroES (HSP10)
MSTQHKELKVHPLFDWVLVEVDKPAERRGMIIIDPDSQFNNVRTATVVAVGRGRKVNHHRVPVGVEPGEKVAFLRWHLEHGTGKKIVAALGDLGENLGLIRGADILFAYPKGTHVEVTL